MEVGNLKDSHLSSLHGSNTSDDILLSVMQMCGELPARIFILFLVPPVIEKYDSVNNMYFYSNASG